MAEGSGGRRLTGKMNALEIVEKSKQIATEMFQSILDFVVVECVFESHRYCSVGLGFLQDETMDEKTAPINKSNDPMRPLTVDIFGQSLAVHNKSLRNLECFCPECSRSLVASRFAPHLEKCMGMGRNSSRIAKRRLAAHAQLNRTTPPRPRTSHTHDAVVGGAALSLESDDDRSGSESRVGSLPDDDDDWLSSSAHKKSTKSATARESRTGRRTTAKLRRRLPKVPVSSSNWTASGEEDSLTGLMPIVDEDSQDDVLFVGSHDERASNNSPAMQLRNRKVKRKTSDKYQNLTKSASFVYDPTEEDSRSASVGFGDLLGENY